MEKSLMAGMNELEGAEEAFRDEVKEITVIRLRPEKDDSDTQSAMNYAIQDRCEED